LKVGRQQLLCGLQLVGAAVDQVLFECAAELYLLDALAYKSLGSLYPSFGGAAVRLGNQNLVVDLMDGERYVVSGKLRLFTGGLYIGLGNIVFPFDLEQIRQRLGELGSAGCDVYTSLIDDAVRRRNWCSSHCAQFPGLEFEELRSGHMRKETVISDRWEICTLGDLLQALFFLDGVAGDPNIVVMLASQLNGFLQGYVARRRPGIACFLGRCNAGGKGCSC
jgi:hypothetical protein